VSKYLPLLKYEASAIARDPINLYMCLFPVIMLLLSSFVFPMIFESIDPAQEIALKVTTLLLLVAILVFGTFFLAAMATFLLVEQKDEHTLNTIAVTPVGASGYLKFKMTYLYLMSVAGIIVVLLGTKLIAGDKYTILGTPVFDNLGISHIVSFALVSGLFAPALGLLQAAFAKNKVERFAFVKGTGILALIPALMILETFQGGLQYVLGIFPNFWAVKGMLLELTPVQNSANLSYPLYLLIGGVYNMMLLIAAYRFFLKKSQY
jgi:fluoroquinolone transport system permease protein